VSFALILGGSVLATRTGGPRVPMRGHALGGGSGDLEETGPADAGHDPMRA
jgi:hypothetical protein